MDTMLNQRTLSEGRRPTILSKNDAYSSSSNYTQNIAYNQSHRHSQDLDDPSVPYYSTTSAGNRSHSPTQDSPPNNEDDTHSSIGNYTQNVAYKHTSSGAGAEPAYDTYYYSTNTAYGANSHGPYEVNIAYGVCSEDHAEPEEEDGAIDYYVVTNDRQDEYGDGFTGDIETHYEVYRPS